MLNPNGINKVWLSLKSHMKNNSVETRVLGDSMWCNHATREALPQQKLNCRTVIPKTALFVVVVGKQNKPLQDYWKF